MELRTISDYLELLEKEMEFNQDEKKAVNMAAYLKGHFKCYGIKSPVRNEIQRKWFAELKKVHFDRWDIVYALWDKPQREYHYIAIDYLRKMPKNGYQKDDYKKLEELIIIHSWWDSVDGIASNSVGQYFKTHPDMIDKVITRWRNSDNMWLNRTCLIFQLKYKDTLDFELLKSLVVQFMPLKEFFIQKAIGWALRQHSKYKPDEVRNFLNEVELKGLALREASKYI